MPDFQVPCAKCKTILIATVANPHIINMFSATMIVVEHPTPVRCPHCDKMMVVTIEQVNKLLLMAHSPLDLQSHYDFSADLSKGKVM